MSGTSAAAASDGLDTKDQAFDQKVDGCVGYTYVSEFQLEPHVIWGCCFLGPTA